ncbi:kinase-like domain-containing protein [Abortiporus biennis]|nr:kinase-like domain-containing protein [Abortiporus biennis]
METVGEMVDFLSQIIEGVQYMHEHNVAHRDIMRANTMMDPQPIFPDLYHPQVLNMTRDAKGTPKYFSRTLKPTKYYLIDFGLSRQYATDQMPPYELPICGGVNLVPEFQGEFVDVPSNPFLTDIWYLGYMMQEFVELYRNLGFLRPLIHDMMQNEPYKRPTIDEVAKRWSTMQSSLNSWKLRSRLVRRDDNVIECITLSLRHAFRTYRYIAKGYKAIPRLPDDYHL